MSTSRADPLVEMQGALQTPSEARSLRAICVSQHGL